MRDPSPELKLPMLRGKYALHACDHCRQRRKKCVGSPPVCQTCALIGYECSWETKSSKRGPRAQQTQRIVYLEKQLEQSLLAQGKSTKEIRMVLSEVDQGGQSLPHGNRRLDVDEELSNSLMGLHLGNNNELLLYGPSSVLSHGQAESTSRFARRPEPNESYILYTAGVPESSINPQLKWDKYLPHLEFFTRRDHDTLLDILLKFFCSWTLRIVQPLFLRDMLLTLLDPNNRESGRAPHYSPMLHNAMVALAIAFSDDVRLCNLQTRQKFVDRAKEELEAEWRVPSISLVHALSILSAYYCSLGEYSLGFMYSGMSSRACQTLGLNVDCSPYVSDKGISKEHMEDRNWTYWEAFCMDVTWSLLLGREPGLAPASSRDVIPFPYQETDGLDLIPWSHPNGRECRGVPEQPGFLSTIFSQTCELFCVARDVSDAANRILSPKTRPEDQERVIGDIDLKLRTWKDHLPRALDISESKRLATTPHRLMLELVYYNLIILLHQRHYQRPGPMSQRKFEHTLKCDEAADHIFGLLEIWRLSFSLRHAPVYITHPVFSCGTIFLRSAIRTANTILPKSRHSYEESIRKAKECMRWLSEIGHSFPFGEFLADKLVDMFKKAQPMLSTVPQPLRQTVSGFPSISGTGHPPRISRRVSAPEPSHKHGSTSLHTPLEQNITVSGDGDAIFHLATIIDDLGTTSASSAMTYDEGTTGKLFDPRLLRQNPISSNYPNTIHSPWS